MVIYCCSYYVWNKFFNADFYRHSGIRSIEGLNHGEDYAIIPRLLHKAQNIMLHNEALYFYNLTNQSSYTLNVNLKSINNAYLAYKINMDYFLYRGAKMLVYAMKCCVLYIKQGGEQVRSPPAYRVIFLYLMLTTTRRLYEMGVRSLTPPLPTTSILSRLTPILTSSSATTCARFSDNFWLYAGVPVLKSA